MSMVITTRVIFSESAINMYQRYLDAVTRVLHCGANLMGPIWQRANLSMIHLMSVTDI